MNMHQVRVYKIGGEKIKVNVGKSHLHKNMKNCLSSEQKTILNGGVITGHRVKWQGISRVMLIKKLAERDGFKCNCPNCCTDREKAISRLGLNWIQVDHIDDNRDNNCLDNLQLLCTTCNSPLVKAKLFA